MDDEPELIAVDEETSNLLHRNEAVQPQLQGSTRPAPLVNPFLNPRGSQRSTINADMDVVVNNRPIQIHPLHQ